MQKSEQCTFTLLIFLVIFVNIKSKYISSAFLLLLSGVVVKVIGALYKIPLTAYIGAVGRGYFATAYNLYLPVHAVTMGAFPMALSKLVSKYNAIGDDSSVFALKKASRRLFFFVGVVGMSVMLVLAVPYSRLVASSDGSIPAIVVLAPCVLFSSLAASYRGYYEGHMNMLPTSVSQTLEALFKMVFGLLFAKQTMAYFYNEFLTSGTVLNKAVSGENAAFSVIYIYSSASAMLGVTLGSLFSLCFLAVYRSFVDRDYRIVPKDSIDNSKRELLSFSFPIMVSCAVQSVFQFLDTASVQHSVSSLSDTVLKNFCAAALEKTTVSDTDLAAYVYGIFSSSLDFKNLIPGITMALGVCAVPAVSRAFELGNKERLGSLIDSVCKYTMLLSLVGGFGLAVFSHDILTVFYGNTAPDVADGCAMLTALFGLSSFVYCLAGTAVFFVQAVGAPQKSIAPYIVSGVVRTVLNVILVRDENLVLYSAVISGAVGYFIIMVWNMIIVKKAAGIKISLSSIFLKPLTVALLSLLLWQSVNNAVKITALPIYILLIKMAIFVIIFILLCFLCGLLKIKDIFCVINTQKNSQTP